MIIKTARTEYDLQVPDKKKRFTENVNRMIKANKREALEKVHAQMIQAEDDSDFKHKIIKKIETALKKEHSEITLKISLPQWQKTGEDSFQKMYLRLLNDAASFHGNMDMMLAYSAVILNAFIHMATVTPYEHHTASQDREFSSRYCLQYKRSQGNHPDAKLVRELMGAKRSNRLPMNTNYY